MVTKCSGGMKMYEPIAIIGMGCAYPPNAFDPEKFFENMMKQKEGVREVGDSVWKVENYFDKDKKQEDKTYCKYSAYLDTLPDVTNLLNDFQLEEKEFANLNHTQKLVVYTILQSLQMANYHLKEFDMAGLFIGNMLGDMDVPNYFLKSRGKEYIKSVEKIFGKQGEKISLSEAEKEAFFEQLQMQFDSSEKENIYPSTLVDDVAGFLGINGVKMVIDSACSASILAIDEAIKQIHSCEINCAIVTGVLGNMGVSGNVAFSKIGGLSDKEARPLDKGAKGLIPGEGAGTLLLKRLTDAVRDNDQILSVIRGTGTSSDGKGQSIYAPSSEGQYRAMKKSLDRAEIGMESIDHIELHATGTAVGDQVEMRAILKLCSELDDPIRLTIGSIKSQIGHSFSAAGMANIIKVIQAMKKEKIPAVMHYEELPSEIARNNPPFFVNKEPIEWEKSPENPRRALVNAFGFGGINANILLEEYDATYHSQLMTKFTSRRNKEENHYAIVGVGAITDYNQNFLNWNSHSTKKRPFEFPISQFKIPPKVLNKIDKSQQAVLLAANEALNGVAEFDSERTGIFVGSTLGLKKAYESDLRIRSVVYSQLLRKILAKYQIPDHSFKEILEDFKRPFETIREDSLPGFMDNIIAGRISNLLDIRGPNVVFDAGRDSFYAALLQGLLALDRGECDQILVGGANYNDMPEFIELFKRYSGDERETRNGASFFLIKREQDVMKDEFVFAKIGKPTLTHGLKEKSTVENDYSYLGAQGSFDLLEGILKRSDTCLRISNSKKEKGFELGICPSEYVFQKKNKFHTLFIHATDINELLYKLEQKREDGDRANLAVVYHDSEDLKGKMELIKKMSEKEK